MPSIPWSNQCTHCHVYISSLHFELWALMVTFNYGHVSRCPPQSYHVVCSTHVQWGCQHGKYLYTDSRHNVQKPYSVFDWCRYIALLNRLWLFSFSPAKNTEARTLYEGLVMPFLQEFVKLNKIAIDVYKIIPRIWLIAFFKFMLYFFLFKSKSTCSWILCHRISVW